MLWNFFWSVLSLFSIWWAVFVWYHDVQWFFTLCCSCINDHFLRYNIDGAELSSQEKIELASKAKLINPAATRLNENPFKEPPVPTSQSQQLFKGVPGECAHYGIQNSNHTKFIVWFFKWEGRLLITRMYNVVCRQDVYSLLPLGACFIYIQWDWMKWNLSHWYIQVWRTELSPLVSGVDDSQLKKKLIRLLFQIWMIKKILRIAAGSHSRFICTWL